MKGVLFGGLFVLLLSSCVLAGSEMGVDFFIGEPNEVATGYVSAETDSDGYLGYAVLIVAVLVGLYFFLREKKKTPKKKSKVRSRKVKARTVSRGKKKAVKKVVKKVSRRKTKR